MAQKVKKRRGKFIEVWNRDDFACALKCVKGDYQRAIVLGTQSLSGNTLPYALRMLYGGKYKISRRNLLSRMQQVGVNFKVMFVNGEKKIIYGEKAPDGKLTIITKKEVR